MFYKCIQTKFEFLYLQKLHMRNKIFNFVNRYEQPLMAENST